MKIREIPQIAIDFITEEEGVRLNIYNDSAGLPTIGIGHVILPGEDFSQGITMEIAQELLRSDLQKAAMAIMRYITAPLTDNQYAALLSWVFNCGILALKRSTLRSRLNRKDYTGAAKEFLRWHWAGGVPNVLSNRRHREMELFLSE